MEVLHAFAQPRNTPAYAIIHPGNLTVEPVSRQDHPLHVLARLPDPRKPRGRRHTSTALIAMAVCTVLAGAKGFTAIGQWTAETTTHALTLEPYGEVLAENFTAAAESLAADELVMSVCAYCSTHFPDMTLLIVISRAEEGPLHYCP